MSPSISTFPSCKTVTTSAVCFTNSISCSITITVQSFFISLSISPVLNVSGFPIPAAGSSSIIISGFCTSCIPISSHCFCPCARAPARSFEKSLSPILSRISYIHSISAFEGLQKIQSHIPLCPFKDSIMFSSTVRFTKTDGT